MDTKHSRCPHCGTGPGATRAPVPAATGTTAAPLLGTAAATAGPASETAAPMTQAQASRVIELLERRAPRRVDVAGPAALASRVLQTMAVIVLFLGMLGIAGALVSMFTAGFWQGLLIGMGTIAATAAYWAGLTVASVIAGYIANRS